MTFLMKLIYLLFYLIYLYAFLLCSYMKPDKTGGSDGMAKLIAEEIRKMTASDASRPFERPMQFYV